MTILPTYDLSKIPDFWDIQVNKDIADFAELEEPISEESARQPLIEIQKFIKLYQQWGFCIIPIKNRDKVPLVGWKQYQTRKPTAAEIEQWYKNYWSKGANLGLIAGQVSQNFIVIDFDTEPAWREFNEDWKACRSDDVTDVTPVVKTSRGYHVYLRCNQPVKKQKLAPRVDIIGEASYVVSPPSISATGHKYHFINPKITQILEINDLSELGINIQLPTEKIEQPLNTTDALDGVPEGQRDATCFKLAARYKAKGLKYEESLLLCNKFANNCNPPFPPDQVEKCAKSAYGYLAQENLGQSEALAHTKAVVTKWLKLKDTNFIDIALATIVANRASGDPVWLLLVGAPSTGKSEILRGLFGCPDVHALGGFTANTFVSGVENKQAGLLERLPEQITLVIKDFGTILTMRHQEKSVILQQLREVYDGEYKKEYGNGKIIHWKGRMGLLGAVTSAIEVHHSVIGELGNRYMLYRFNTSDESRSEIAQIALDDAGLEKQIREDISSAFTAALQDTHSPDFVVITSEIKQKVSVLADLVSRLRSPVSRDSYRKSINYQPDIEGPARLVKAFAKLGKGLTALRGKVTMTDSEYVVIRRVGRDTVPLNRVKILRYLFDGEWHPAKELSSESDIPPATLTLLLEDLLQIGAVIREPGIKEGETLTQTSPYRWMVNGKIANMLTVTGFIKPRIPGE